MNCRRISNLLSAYMDGELTGVEMLQIRRHLDDCQSCNLQYEELRQAKQLLARLPFQQPRAGLAESICAQLDCVKVPGYQRFMNRIASYGRRHVTPVAAGCVGLAGVMMFFMAQPEKAGPLVAETHTRPVTFASSIGLESASVESYLPVDYNPHPQPRRLYIPSDSNEDSGSGRMFTLTSFQSP